MLSIVIPCHNERRRIAPTLSALAKFLHSGKNALGSWSRFEIIIVDDSSDGTLAVARQAAKTLGLQLVEVQFPRRMGKGFAVRAGIMRAGGDVLLYDADASVAPCEMLKLKSALDAGADVAIGSRFVKGASVQGQPAMRKIAGRAFNLLCRTVLGIPFHDTQCGFKAARASAARAAAALTDANGYSWDLQFILKALEKGFTVVEVPISWKHKAHGTISGVPVHAALEIGGDMLRFRLAK